MFDCPKHRKTYKFLFRATDVAVLNNIIIKKGIIIFSFIAGIYILLVAI